MTAQEPTDYTTATESLQQSAGPDVPSLTQPQATSAAVRASRIILWSLMVICIGLHGVLIIDDEIRVVAILAAVSLGGLIGIATNHLAITMLFRPKDHPVLGWRGLIPANQPAIAKQVGATAKDLFSRDYLRQRLADGSLIEQGMTTAAEGVHALLADATARDRIRSTATSIYDCHASSAYAWLSERLDTIISTWFAREFTAEQAWAKVRPMVLDLLHRFNLRQEGSQAALRWIAEQAGPLADQFMRAIDDYFTRHIDDARIHGLLDFVNPKLLFRKAKHSLISSQINRDQIIQLIHGILHDQRTQDRLVAAIDAGIEELDEVVNRNRDRIAELHGRVRDLVAQHGREALVPWIDRRVRLVLRGDRLWTSADSLVRRTALTVTGSMASFAGHPAIVAALQDLIPDTIDRLGLDALVEDRINQLDTDGLERMVVRVAGHHLAAIEILGAALGAVAGLGLIWPAALVILLPLGGVGLWWIKQR